MDFSADHASRGLPAFPELDKQPGESTAAKWISFRAQVLQLFKTADPSDTDGLIPAFLTTAAYRKYLRTPDTAAATAPYAAPAHPGNLDGAATAGEIFIFKEKLARYNHTARATPLYQLALHNSLPRHLQSRFWSDAANAPELGTPQAQWTALETAIGTLTEREIDREDDKIRIAYRLGTPLAEFFDTHQSVHRLRSHLSLPYSTYEKMKYAKAALTHCGAFRNTLSTFEDKYPAETARTFELLRDHVIAHGDRDLSSLKADLSTASAVSTLNEKLTREMAELRAEMIALRKSSSRFSGTPAPAYASGQKPSVHFCWTCGTQTGHSSFKCPQPAAGHQRNATKKDTMGSPRPV